MASFKSVPVGLLASTTTTYDQTKSTYAGQAALRTVLGQSVISPPIIKWVDVLTDTAETGAEVDYTPNGRAFVVTAISNGLARLIMYNFNAATGVFAYVGKVQLTFPNVTATTHTLHGLKVDDSVIANIRVFVTTTGTTAINGGLFYAPNLVLGDFVQSGFATLPMGSGSNQKAVYFLQDPANVGANQLNISAASIVLDRANLIAYVHNGISATHQYYLYDYSLTPNVPSQTATITIASPGVVTASTAHGYVAGDPIIFSTSGTLPNGTVAGTTYFVIAAGLTATAFEFSASSGGVAINTTGTQSGTQSVMRAFGIVGTNWKWKTANLNALSGTLLINNSEVYCVPQHSLNSGSPCIFFASSSTLYLVKISDLTSGQTNMASLVQANLLGSANQIVSPTAATADWDDTFDRAIFTTSTTKFVAKQMVNNSIQAIYGELNNDYLEGLSQTDLYTQFGALSITDVRVKNGWHFILGSAVGQRGIIAINHGADTKGDATYVISPVVTLAPNSLLNGITLSRVLRGSTSEPVIFYRTSGFGSVTGGWIQLTVDLSFPANTTATQIQLKVEWNFTGVLSSQPHFPYELYIRHLPPTYMSDNWAFDEDSTTVGTNSPSYVGFTMLSVYATGTVPQLFLRGVAPTTNNLIIGPLDTVTNQSLVQYSTDGSTWNALGTIPNVAGTKIRWLISTPPTGTAVMTMRES